MNKNPNATHFALFKWLDNGWQANYYFRDSCNSSFNTEAVGIHYFPVSWATEMNEAKIQEIWGEGKYTVVWYNRIGRSITVVEHTPLEIVAQVEYPLFPTNAKFN